MASQSAIDVDISITVSKRFISKENGMNVLPRINTKCLNSFELSGCCNLVLGLASCSVCCSNTMTFKLAATNYLTY